MSDLFEGDIDDVAIFKESGLMKHLYWLIAVLLCGSS